MSDDGGDGSSSSSSSSSSYSSSSSSAHHRPVGPFGIDPLNFSIVMFSLLLLFVFYLLLPRAVRKQYFGGYPKRHAWSARSRSARRSTAAAAGGYGPGHPGSGQPAQSSMTGSYTAGSSLNHGHPHHLTAMTNTTTTTASASALGNSTRGSQMQLQQQGMMMGLMDEEQVDFSLQQNDEIVISAAMQQLRDPGVLIVAHGSRGKPKTVRLQLTESAITWRTETRKKGVTGGPAKPKLGKLHQVPLSHIMYVDVGKQTTALRRVENASVSEALCFSLLTKEGSLDLEANSPRERDALVSCFSLVLDEVHAQNWRDIYRGPSSDMPSSFDELDAQHQADAAAAQAINNNRG